AEGISFDGDLIRYLETKADPRPDWTTVLPGRLPLLSFWYRVSPRRMVTLDFDDNHMTPGKVRRTEPPTTLSGMINLSLDGHGHLLDFQAIPPQQEDAPHASAAPDWDLLFAAAGLDRTQLQPAEPTWTSLAASDARA